MSNEEMIPRFRFDALRVGAVEALRHVSTLLYHQENGNHIEEYEVYHELVAAVQALAKGLSEGTQP